MRPNKWCSELFNTFLNIIKSLSVFQSHNNYRTDFIGISTKKDNPLPCRMYKLLIMKGRRLAKIIQIMVNIIFTPYVVDHPYRGEDMVLIHSSKPPLSKSNVKLAYSFHAYSMLTSASTIRTVESSNLLLLS